MPMGLQTSVYVDDVALRRKLEEYKIRFKDFSDPMAKIGELLVASIKKNFEVGGRPAWRPLSPATILRKGHSTILVDTGRLRESVEFKAEREYVEVGSFNMPERIYGEFHQKGTDRIPQREWRVMQPDDRSTIVVIMHEFVRDVVAAKEAISRKSYGGALPW